MPAFLADEQHGHFTGLLIHLRDQLQLIRPAPQTSHIELAERTLAGRLAGLVILAPLEIPGTTQIHNSSSVKTDLKFRLTAPKRSEGGLRRMKYRAPFMPAIYPDTRTFAVQP